MKNICNNQAKRDTIKNTIEKCKKIVSMRTSKRAYKLQKIYENSTCVKVGTKITTVGFGMKKQRSYLWKIEYEIYSRTNW